MPLDKEKLDDILDIIKFLETLPEKREDFALPKQNILLEKTTQPEIKPSTLGSSERKIYFYLSHFFRLTLLSIPDTAVALETWVNILLPYFMTNLSVVDEDSWAIICEKGDNDKNLQKELDEDWIKFYNHYVKKNKIKPKILKLLGEGRKKALRKMDSNK